MTSPTTYSTALDVRTKDGVKFGKELREKDFLFQEGYLNLNHGEYTISSSISLRFLLSKCLHAFFFKYKNAFLGSNTMPPYHI